MSNTDALAEIEQHFPARGLAMNVNSKIGKSPIFGFERNCSLCGKPFISYAGHVYRHDAAQRGHKRVECYFCSWTCMRTWERERAAELARAKK